MPVRLRGRSPGIEDLLVVPATGVIVSSARRADTLRRAAGEVHPFAFVAPTPVTLTRRRSPVIRDAVVAAAGALVRAARRTMPFGGMSVEEQRLALMAPPPVG